MADINKELECPICLERLSNPRCLACNHVYCLECLQDLENAIGVLNSVVCPECRHRTMMRNDQTVADLHSPVPLRKLEAVCDSIEDFVRNVEQGSALGDSCEFCRQVGMVNPYVAFCLQCPALLCNECTRQHASLPMFQAHSVTRNVKFCTRHRSKVSTMFCRDCTEFVCHLCAVATAHNGHSVDPLSIAVSKQKRSTDQLMNTASTFIASLHDLNVNINDALRQLRTQGDAINRQIRQNQNPVHRRDVASLVNVLQRHIASQEDILHDFQDVCNDSIRDLNEHIAHFEYLCSETEDDFTFIVELLDIKRTVEAELKRICNFSVDVDIPTYTPSTVRNQVGSISTGVIRTYGPAVRDSAAIGTRICSSTQDGKLMSNGHKKITMPSFMQKHTLVSLLGIIVLMSILITGILALINILSAVFINAFDSNAYCHHILQSLGLTEGLQLDSILPWRAWFVVSFLCSSLMMAVQYVLSSTNTNIYIWYKITILF